MRGPSTASAATVASRTTAVLTSTERATWPFCRGFLAPLGCCLLGRSRP